MSSPDYFIFIHYSSSMKGEGEGEGDRNIIHFTVMLTLTPALALNGERNRLDHLY